MDIIIPSTIAFGILGSIYAGIASVTESATVGVFAVLLVAYFRKELSFKIFKESLKATIKTCGTLLWIGIGAYILVGVYNLTGGNKFVQNLILGLDLAPVLIILLMMMILFFLGMFIDWIGIAMLTMPIFVPIILQMGMDPIWFGILFCVNMQISFLSPPFGPACFYLHSVAPKGIGLSDIFRSVLPFMLIQFILLLLLVLFPQITLFLPELLQN